MPNYRITATSLWLRSGPGTNFPAVGALYRNNIVQGDEIRGEWLHVATGEGKTGWCNRGYVELVETAPPPPPAGVNYRVNVASLNVRAGGGLGYPVIGYLKNGEIVEGLGRSSDGQWAQIRKPDGVVGWASMKYLSKIVIPPLDSAEVYMIVATDRLNIRSGPGETFTVLAQSNRGDFLQFLSSTPDWKWVKVKTQANQIGWCSSKYVTERADGVARNEDFPVKGFHRALSDSIPLRTGPAADAPPVTDLKFNRVVYVDAISPDGKWKHCNNAWGEKGWYPVERLAALGGVAMPKPDEEFAWLPIAFEEFGTREVPGVRNNPRIVEYHKSTDLAQKYANLPDEVDWCASFVNWCVEKANAPSANSALVHPWTKWGVAAPAPRRGCVMTFLWDDGFAHVAFYLGEVGNYVICLGGNQSDAVWTSVYHKKYITSYRVR